MWRRCPDPDAYAAGWFAGYAAGCADSDSSGEGREGDDWVYWLLIRQGSGPAREYLLQHRPYPSAEAEGAAQWSFFEGFSAGARAAQGR